MLRNAEHAGGDADAYGSFSPPLLKPANSLQQSLALLRVLGGASYLC